MGRFLSHARCGEGIAIRDFEGCLWWDKDIPEQINQVMMQPDRKYRAVRIYEMQSLAEDEFASITNLNTAFLVDLPGNKIPLKHWRKLENESKIAMLSFQFKN